MHGQVMAFDGPPNCPMSPRQDTLAIPRTVVVCPKNEDCWRVTAVVLQGVRLDVQLTS